MDKTSYKVLTLTVACMLLLSIAVQRVIAWPCKPPGEPCDDCYICTPTGCEWDCTVGATCCNGSCCDSGNCCNSTTCCTNYDDVCCTDSGSYCCESNETCCEGSCCDSVTQVCCDGSCCDKVWTKETTTAFDQSCPACSNYYWGCVGTPKTQPSYERCLNVGVGPGEHCQCNETLQVVGYVYYCKANWDVAKLLWCVAQGAWCVVECAVSGFDPSSCAECLVGIGGCGTGFMEICDFVESCDPYDPSEIEDFVFTGFGC